MKMTTILALVLAIVPFMIFAANGAEAEEGQSKKILVAYFSWSGNTREIAEQIQKRVGGELFEIRTVQSYPTEYRACTEVARKEQQSNARPELSTKVADMKPYDVVFIGYPNWWGTLPMPLFTFLEGYDLSGKTVIPFCTHEGSGLGRSVQDIAKLCPGVKILEGLAIRGGSVKSAGNDVASWLRGIGMGD